ncbi:regulator of G protein signaling domain-containing protein [Filobasidium floriforme]|uniref:regulator of G protein signaling domain-containing protein n=1 Tax=Filobasidium floriforme TaxID=5210 RepID=UPI001E8D9FE7|nr:regulator of G protein signaling domain-containing protein [Filobasidium floriforme]KAH8087899.1 regulator of G protein signaling domain-containing protein [Filobasidium floriforme]
MSANTSHLMKTTRRGRPFVKDTHDLFATLIVSLRLENHRSLFKVYPNSFSTDEACTNLASLKFSQSNRSPDPKDPTRIVTTTTTTTFSMTRDMAKGICQHFMDARLIENAADLDNLAFKDRGIYMLTPKGLHVLERFITKNGISAEHLLKVFATQSICLKLLHLERRAGDDEILIGKAVIEIIFKRFLGRQPNLARQEDERNLGLVVKKVPAVEREKSPPTPPGGPSSPEKEKDKITFTHDIVFLASAGMDWLCDFTTIVGRDEAAEMCAHFVRYGLIKLVPDTKTRPLDPAKIVVVRTASAPTGLQTGEAEFRFMEKTYYKVTPEGRRWAKWTDAMNRPSLQSSSSSQPGKSVSPEPYRSSEDVQETARNPTRSLSSTTDDRMIRRTSLVDRLRLEYLDIGASGSNRVVVDDKHQFKDSHTSKLKQILEEPSLRSLFREFLRANFCEENLSFWLDVQDFKRRFNTTSSAVASPLPVKGPAQKPQGHSAMERHQQDLIAMAFVIYNTYLAPASSCELNIDHNLREELVSYMSKIVAEVSTREGKDAVSHGTLDPAMAAKSLQASQLQTMVRLYERIQSYIFRLMATDSVPKFCKTEKYVEIMQAVFDHEIVVVDADSEGKRDQIDDLGMKSPARAYVTISQAANEKQAALLKSQQQNDSAH